MSQVLCNDCGRHFTPEPNPQGESAICPLCHERRGLARIEADNKAKADAKRAAKPRLREIVKSDRERRQP